MKFTCTTEINLPLVKVVELFDNTDNYKYWQQGFVRYDHISGIAGQPGAKSKIIMDTGKFTIELIETIQVKNLPQESSALYEHDHMVNTMTNRFYAIDEGRTRYATEIHYTRFIGFMPKMMALFMPGVFKKQVQKTIDSFKSFAEKETTG